MALNQGTVTAWAAVTSTGNATSVIQPKLISAEVTSTPKTTLSALGVATLRQISVAAVLAVGSFPTKSFCLAGDSTALTLPAASGFATAFELVAEDGTSARREWSLVDTPYTVSGGTGAVYAALPEEAKLAYDAALKPTKSTMTLEQAIALALKNQPVDSAALVTFNQSNNKLKVHYGTEANLDTFIAACEALTIAADKQVVGTEFEDVIADDSPEAVSYLE